MDRNEVIVIVSAVIGALVGTIGAVLFFLFRGV